MYVWAKRWRHRTEEVAGHPGLRPPGPVRAYRAVGCQSCGRLCLCLRVALSFKLVLPFCGRRFSATTPLSTRVWRVSPSARDQRHRPRTLLPTTRTRRPETSCVSKPSPDIAKFAFSANSSHARDTGPTSRTAGGSCLFMGICAHQRPGRSIRTGSWCVAPSWRIRRTGAPYSMLCVPDGILFLEPFLSEDIATILQGSSERSCMPHSAASVDSHMVQGSLGAYSRKPDCFRSAASRIQSKCDDLETNETARVQGETNVTRMLHGLTVKSGAFTAAISLTLCELATADHYSLPLECASFEEAGTASHNTASLRKCVSCVPAPPPSAIYP